MNVEHPSANLTAAEVSSRQSAGDTNAAVRWLPWLVLAVLAAVALFANPYFYDQGNSGRYLTGVLRILDPSLFPGDEVAASLSRFESIFYDGLGSVLRLVGAAPEALASTIYTLYLLSRLLLCLLLFLLGRQLSQSYWPALLLVAWAVHAKTLPLGGTQLFANTLRHTEVTILVELVALICLFRGRTLFFWLLASLAIFIHALVALHFILAIAPPLFLLALFRDRKLERGHIFGAVVFGAAVLLYYSLLAPPPFTAEEARIFLAAKGDINHISFAGTPLLRWLQLFGQLGLAAAVYWQYLRSERHATLLLSSTFAGAILALALSAVAIITEHPLPALIQPLRAFLWVAFFAHLLLALALGQSVRRPTALTPILLGYFLFSILESIWAIALAFLGIGYVLATTLPAVTKLVPPVAVERWSGRALALLAGGIALAALLGGRLPANLGDFRFIIPALGLALLAFPLWRSVTGRLALVGFLFTYVLLFASLNVYNQYEAITDPDWQTVCRWAGQNSDKDDRFIVTYTAESFRTCAFRTAVSHDFAALAWVDPNTFVETQQQAQLIRAGFDGSAWDSDYLIGLAHEWDAVYLITDGPVEPAVSPVFQAGRFSVIEIRD
jgi:hypothetical protein